MERQWTKEEALRELKTNYRRIGHPVAFGNANTIYNFFRKTIPLKEIKEYLSSINAFTLHTENRKRARDYIPMYAFEPRQLVEMDLIDMHYFSPNLNDNVRYLLIAIDTFTRAIFLEGIENKKTETVLKAFIKYHDLYQKHDNS